MKSEWPAPDTGRFFFIAPQNMKCCFNMCCKTNISDSPVNYLLEVGIRNDHVWGFWVFFEYNQIQIIFLQNWYNNI